MNKRLSSGKRGSMQKKLFVMLLILVLFLGGLNLAKARGWLIPEQPLPNVRDKIIVLDSLTLEQKIAQMIVVHGGLWNLEPWKRMQLGGIQLYALQDAELYQETINKFQENMTIPFLVTVDLEGCWNPFANFQEFKAASEIATIEEAEQKGEEEGKFLKELGFTTNFAPVVDLNDEIWKCRSFPGNEENITQLAEAYVRALQEQGIMATVKHYPGKTLVAKDPHKFLVKAEISAADLYPFIRLEQESGVKALMVSHVISTGEVDSGGKPATGSPEVFAGIKQNFSGLVISDEINMLGLKDYYASLDEMYVAVFKAGNDIILDFSEDPQEIYRMIQVVKVAVEKGEISEEQLDASVKKILEMKGFIVV